MTTIEKKTVYDFWNDASCGEDLYLKETDRAGYEAQAKIRYQLEPYIIDFARFSEAKGKKVLEIGVGLGADHQQFADAGADLYGVDLTERAIEHTRNRLVAFGLESKLSVGDAEKLDFPNESFNQVYSWGVLHHSPNTRQAIAEVWRILKPGGNANIMIYHKWSIVGLMLWVRYALLVLQPWRTLTNIYAHHLESPGTKAYSISQARQLFHTFSDIEISIVLTHGDLLESEAGQRHQGRLLTMARKIWPRNFIKRYLPNYGLFMLINATK